MKQRYSIEFGSSWKTALSPGIKGQSLVSWISEQIIHVSTNFASKGHSLRACFFLHFGQKMAKASAFVFCLFWIWRVSSYSLRLPRMSVLNSSSIFPISTLLTVLVVDLFSLIREGTTTTKMDFKENDKSVALYNTP